MSVSSKETESKIAKDTQKEPESAVTLCEECINHIKMFKHLREEYLKHEATLKTDSEKKNDIKLACLKSALMQLIALIGDRLTWLRQGQSGREYYKSSEPVLYAFAAKFRENTLQTIIYFRNLYPHKFLYMDNLLDTDIIKKHKEFKKSLKKDVLTALSTIEETMSKELDTLKGNPSLKFTGKINKPYPEFRHIDVCWTVALQEILLLENFYKKKTELETILEEQTVKYAIDGCIKNICQSYQDYKQQLEPIPKQGHSQENCHVIREIQADATKAHITAFSTLDRAYELRKHLAHPNMKSEVLKNNQLREKFLNNLHDLKSAFLALINLSKNKKKRIKEGSFLSFEAFQNIDLFYFYVNRTAPTQKYGVSSSMSSSKSTSSSKNGHKEKRKRKTSGLAVGETSVEKASGFSSSISSTSSSLNSSTHQNSSIFSGSASSTSLIFSTNLSTSTSLSDTVGSSSAKSIPTTIEADKGSFESLSGYISDNEAGVGSNPEIPTENENALDRIDLDKGGALPEGPGF